MEFDNRELREAAVEKLQNRVARMVWRELRHFTRIQDYKAEMGSTQRKLLRFASKKQFLRLMGLPVCNLNFDQIVEEGWRLIVNLKETDHFSVDNGMLIGTLIINALVHAVMRRKEPPKNPYFLLIDEASDFISSDVRETLDKGAGPGLHLGLFLQNLGQIQKREGWIYNSVLSGCGVRVIFAPDAREASVQAKELFGSRETKLKPILEKLQPREYILDVPFKGTIKDRTPDVGRYVSSEQTILDRFIKPYALPVEEIDAELERRLAILTPSKQPPATDPMNNRRPRKNR